VNECVVFCCFQPKTVNLDLAAKLLIGDANIDRTGCSKFKSKTYCPIMFELHIHNYDAQLAFILGENKSIAVLFFYYNIPHYPIPF